MTLWTSTPACPGGVIPTSTPSQPGPSSASSLGAAEAAGGVPLAVGGAAADATLAGVLLGEADCPAGEHAYAANPNVTKAGATTARESMGSWYHATHTGAARGPVLRVSLVCSVFVLGACGSPPPVAKVPTSAGAPSVTRSVWPRFGEVRSWPPSEPFTNRGHAGAGPNAVVRVSPVARESYTHLVRDSALPDDSVVALFHLGVDQRPGPVYVMEKSAGTWRFLALDADGAVVAPSTSTGQSTQGCQGCHADAVADSLFGVPRGQ